MLEIAEQRGRGLIENGAVVGYLSVRSKPDRAAVAAAERLYAAMRGGQAEGVRIEKGRVIVTRWAGFSSQSTARNSA